MKIAISINNTGKKILDLNYINKKRHIKSNLL